MKLVQERKNLNKDSPSLVGDTKHSQNIITMASRDTVPPAEYTTNEEDRKEAEKLKDRLRNRAQSGSDVVERKVAPVQVSFLPETYLYTVPVLCSGLEKLLHERTLSSSIYISRLPVGHTSMC